MFWLESGEPLPETQALLSVVCFPGYNGSCWAAATGVRLEIAWLSCPKQEFIVLTPIMTVTRSVGIKVYGGEDKMTSIDKVGVSGLAGSTAGAVAGLARKYSYEIPCQMSEAI